ncbi:MAG: outer membrane beta-barrel protein [Bacteroidales bacterium]|nr:outer membrane beta-barrel protein [Bacteroidales bacterium]
MKKYIFAVIILVFILPPSAFTQSVGLRGGLSLANGMYKLTSIRRQTHFMPGLTIGIVGDVPLSESVYLNSGFLFIKKGTKRHISDVDEKIPVRYLEIPVNFCYKFDFITWKLYGQAGLYSGIGLSARRIRGDDKEKIEFGTELEQFKRMDYGVNFGLGVELDNYTQISMNYGVGFRNFSNRFDEKIRNRVLTITIAYPIGEIIDFIRYL